MLVLFNEIILPMPIDLSFFSTEDLVAEVTRRLNCLSKPERRLILIGNVMAEKERSKEVVCGCNRAASEWEGDTKSDHKERTLPMSHRDGGSAARGHSIGIASGVRGYRVSSSTRMAAQ